MSIMGMRRKFAQHLKVIMWVVVAVFVIGIPLGVFYSRSYISQESDNANLGGKSGEVIATVGKLSLTRAELESSYQNLLRQMISYGGQKVPLDRVLQLRLQALMQAVNDLVLSETARQAGITLSRSEIQQGIDREARQFVDQLKEVAARQGKDPREIYRLYMAQQGTSRSRISEEDFLTWLKKQVFAPRQKEFEQNLLLEKYRNSIISSVQINDAELQAAFDEAKLRLILIATTEPKRTEAEAKQKAEEIYVSLQKGDDFAALAKSASDAESALFAKEWMARSNLRAMLGEEAEKGLFALAPGKYTAPMKFPQGYVLLQLLEKRSNLPEDFAKNKEALRKRLLVARQQDAWDKVVQENLEKMPVTPKDPEITALQALQEGKLKEAEAAFEKVLMDTPDTIPGEVFSAVGLYLAQSYFNAKDLVKTREKLDAALAPPQGVNRELVSGYPEEIYLLIGQLALEQDNKAEALRNFAQADNNANENPMVHMQLKRIYDELKETEKAKEQEQWLQEYAQFRQQLQQQAEEATEAEPKTSGPAKSSEGQK